ncbi:MAG: hypothetical protein Q9166_007144 [cf. Caloplaca sp. 2 TL-2023]
MDLFKKCFWTATNSTSLGLLVEWDNWCESRYSSSQDSTTLKTASWELSVSQLALALILICTPVHQYCYTIWKAKSASKLQKNGDPPTLPYSLPILGHLLLYLYDATQLASSITRTFGPSAVARLNFLQKEIYVISGAEYLNAVWKNTKGLTSTNGINLALHNMFNTSKQDMKFFEADKSGITHDPHPQSSTSPENRVFYLMHKATVDCLAGSHLTLAAQRFESALRRNIDGVPVQDEWVEMDDLFEFLRPLISCSTVEAMCGANFLKAFPDFVATFWTFNNKMPRLLQGYPRWMIPRAWQARDRCISTMRQWRKITNDENFDGNVMIQRRWDYFSKMQGLSDDGVACSDLGILWGMNSNSVPATFWLFWHLIRDRELLGRAASEVNTSRIVQTTMPLSFDTTKLCQQPLLQSSYAETLRLYVAVYLIRKPEHTDAQVLDYKVPKDKMITISSAVAHMDKRNWNLGMLEEHPVQEFWADRFLTYGSSTSRSTTASFTMSSSPTAGSSTSTDVPATSIKATNNPAEPKFSLNGYSGAWIPFGGGIHQCPGRHWVKLQMLLSFAMISSAFDIELLSPRDTLRVDKAKYGLGTLQPAEKAPIRIRRKKTALQL